MNKNILFKLLVDALYFTHFILFLGFLIIFPLGINNIEKFDIIQINAHFEETPVLIMTCIVISILTYLIFLRGLNFLRIVAKFLISNRFFSERIIINLKKSGIHFLFTGVLSFFVMFLIWIGQVINGKIVFSFNDKLVVSTFLIIIGLFFMIQGETLSFAKNIKDENDLTI